MWTERLIGVLLFGLVVTLAFAALSHMIPDRAGQFISVQARMLDSLRPHLLVVVVILAVVLLAVGQTRLAALGVCGALLVLVSVVADYALRTAPQDSRSDLSVLWFNMLETNDISPEALAQALKDADVDVILLAESVPAADVPALMSDTHPYQLGCDTQDGCGIMLMSRVAFGPSRIRDLPSGQDRFMRVVIERPDRMPVHLIAIHMAKPWFIGFAETETEALEAALNADVTPPTILVGDFNAAPWSRRIRRLEQGFGLRHAPRPIATWPVGAGPLGVPIDHILLRGGTGFVQIMPWGDELGSNHRGLRAVLSLPQR